MSRPSYQELEKKIRELEDEALIYDRIKAELLEKQSILRNQNINLVKKSIQLSEIKRELEDKNYDLELSQSELEKARDELEQRVVQRTAELIKANEQLNQEIENRKQTEEALQGSRNMLKIVLDTIPCGIFWKDRDSIYQGGNRTWLAWAGLNSSGEAIGKSDYELPWSKEEADSFREDDRRIMESGIPKYNIIEPYFRADDGIRAWAKTNKVPLRDKEGNIIGVLGTSEDITELKWAEDMLQDQKECLANIIEGTNVGTWEWNVQTGETIFNERWAEIIGYKLEELSPVSIDTWIKYTHPDDLKASDEMLRKHFNGERAYYDCECRMKHKDRHWVWILDRGKVISWTDDGKPLWMYGTHTDITERKQAEKALRKSEKKYRTLLKTTSEGYWIIDPEYKTIEVNQALCNMIGYSQDEMLGKTPFDFVDDENRKIFVEQTSKIPTTSHRSYEITLKKKNGEDLYTHFNASTIRDESGDIQGAFALITDITERKKAQEERDHLATAIEQAAESVFITDRDGIIQYVNPAFERLTGYSRKDAIGQNPRILKSGKHDALFYKEMWDTITRGDAWYGRFINKKKDGGLYEADGTISPVSDTSGKITNFVSIKRDITHEIELEKQLIQSQKMEAIGTLAGGVAHDFNNILTAIIGYAGLALTEVPKETPLYDDVQEVLNAGHRAKDLVRQILTFSRKSEEEKAPVQIRHLVKEALKFLRSSLPATIEIREEIAREIGIVNANPTQIHQVIMNLCTNASHAMQKKGGILEVGLRNVDFDSRYAARYPDIDPGKYLRLTVSDTGEGMTSEVMDRIFEPYFTTKEKGVGAGMGLSVVHGIVKSHGGTITVYSKPEKGSIFQVYIPLIKGGVKRPEIDEDIVIPAGNEHILFIDDEPALVDLGKRMFEQLGYEVTSRTSSIEALELFKAQPDRFDLVITDMTMPNMMGDKLAHELMKIRPDIPVILCTGYSERITEEKTKKVGIKAFVMKPLIMRDLSNTVRKVLDRN